MPVSHTAIANRALTKIGAERIEDIDDVDDDTKQATVVRSMYDIVRDAELRRHVWSFSKTRVELAAEVAVPEFGYAYQYVLPVDPYCLRVLSINESGPGLDLSDFQDWIDQSPYSIEGRKILTFDSGPLRLRYCARITDASEFDSCFVEVFASRLAYEICEDLTESSAKKDRALQDYDIALTEAVRANALELPPKKIHDDTWLSARL